MINLIFSDTVHFIYKIENETKLIQAYDTSPQYLLTVSKMTLI